MNEEAIRYAYRLCPCFPSDIEGVQSWLEDMAAQGLVLEADGAFLGIFTFRRQQPQALRYRLTPVKEKKGFFQDNDAPDLEEQEFSQSCGWEYMLRYGQFFVYRATDPEARPLHTEPQVQALALGALSRRWRQTVVFEVCFWTAWLLLRGGGTLSLFRSGALIGPVWLGAVLGLLVWVAATLTAAPIRLRRYQKRLRAGDTLERRKPWKKAAPAVLCAKALPWVLGAVLAFGWLQSLGLAYEKQPLERLPHPFPTMSDVLPGQELDRVGSIGDYNTGVHYANALSANTEWNESCSGQLDGQRAHCILRLSCYETAGEFWAKGVEEDIYRYEKGRYHGKRFEDLTVPETALDSVRAFSSYGITHVLVRQGSTVLHAVVSITTPDQKNHWPLWLQAAEELLLP